MANWSCNTLFLTGPIEVLEQFRAKHIRVPDWKRSRGEQDPEPILDFDTILPSPVVDKDIYIVDEAQALANDIITLAGEPQKVLTRDALLAVVMAQVTNGGRLTEEQKTVPLVERLLRAAGQVQNDRQSNQDVNVLENTRLALTRMARVGQPDDHIWRLDTWGTSRNSGDLMEISLPDEKVERRFRQLMEDSTVVNRLPRKGAGCYVIQFYTAWTPPTGIFEAIARQYPIDLQAHCDVEGESDERYRYNFTPEYIAAEKASLESATPEAQVSAPAPAEGRDEPDQGPSP